MFENFFSKVFGKQASGSAAKNRLQMVLVQDRSGLSTQEMDLFRKDLLDVISKYFELENRDLDIEWQRSSTETALMINTPVRGRTRAEAKAAAAAKSASEAKVATAQG